MSKKTRTVRWVVYSALVLFGLLAAVLQLFPKMPDSFTFFHPTDPSMPVEVVGINSNPENFRIGIAAGYGAALVAIIIVELVLWRKRKVKRVASISALTRVKARQSKRRGLLGWKKSILVQSLRKRWIEFRRKMFWRWFRMKGRLPFANPPPVLPQMASAAHIAKFKHDDTLTFWTIVVICYCISVLIGLVLLLFSWEVPYIGDVNVGLTYFAFLLVYTAKSFDTVPEDELGARLFFRRPIDNLTSGPVFIPLGICSLKTCDRNAIQMELPAEPGDIFRGEGNTPPGMSPPIRVKFADKFDPKNPRPLDREVTEEVTPVVRGRITDPCSFFANMGNTDKLREQLHDASVGVVFTLLTKDSLAQAFLKTKTYNTRLTKAINVRLNVGNPDLSWGFELESAQIKLFTLSKKLNEAIQSVAEEQAKKPSTIVAAQAEAEATEIKGKGKGKGRKGELDGETDGLLRRTKELQLTGAQVLGAETARNLTANPNGTTIIAGAGGFGEFVGVASAVNTALTNGKKGKESGKPEPVPTV